MIGLRRHPLRVGIAGLVVAVVFLYFAFSKQVPFIEGYRVDAVFDNTVQLRTGTPVRIAGVDVGEVVSSELGSGDTVVMTLELKDAARPVHVDATVKIHPRLFLEGSYALELRPGSPSAPELEDGATIGLGQTAAPVQFNQVLTTFPKPVRGAIGDAVDELATALDEGGAEGLGAAQKPLAPMLRDSAIVAEAARGSERHDVSDLLRGSSRFVGALASRDDELADLVTDLRRTTGVFAARSSAVSAGLRELDGTLGEAPAALSALDRALPPTRRITAALRPSLRLLPEVLDDSIALLGPLRGLASQRELGALLDDLTPALRGLPKLTSGLREVLPLVTPIADCLRERAIPVLTSKLDDGKHSTGRPVYMELVHGTVGLAGASQSFDGNGLGARYLGSFGEDTLTLTPLRGGKTLFGSGTTGTVGSRPRPLPDNAAPPFRPDAECRKQPAPDLTARTEPLITPTRRAATGQAKPSAASLQSALRELARRSQAGER